MKTRIWIVLTLVAFLLTSGLVVNVSAAHADSDSAEWTLVGKGHAAPPGGGGGNDGDDGDGGSDVEGDPENWLGGQNRPADANDDGGFRLIEWFYGLLYAMTFGLIR